MKTLVSYVKIEHKRELRDKKRLSKLTMDIDNSFAKTLTKIMNMRKIDVHKAAYILRCDTKTVQNYLNGKTIPDTIEKVMLICLMCDSGPELGELLIRQTVGGIPDIGMKKQAYKFLLHFTNTSLDYWNLILREFGIDPILRYNKDDSLSDLLPLYEESTAVLEAP
jgi:hypothetical protein